MWFELLPSGECIKILISGDPKFSPINFDVVDNELIAICRNLRLSLSQIKSVRIDGAVRQAQVDLRCARRTERLCVPKTISGLMR